MDETPQTTNGHPQEQPRLPLPALPEGMALGQNAMQMILTYAMVQKDQWQLVMLDTVGAQMNAQMTLNFLKGAYNMVGNKIQQLLDEERKKIVVASADQMPKNRLSLFNGGK